MEGQLYLYGIWSRYSVLFLLFFFFIFLSVQVDQICPYVGLLSANVNDRLGPVPEKYIEVCEITKRITDDHVALHAEKDNTRCYAEMNVNLEDVSLRWLQLYCGSLACTFLSCIWARVYKYNTALTRLSQVQAGVLSKWNWSWS